jgi:uncharacterized repeat protein (TIGR03837 family)
MMKKPVWDIFCQVIDNWGDAGICWRLATQLGQRGISARLWIDDPQPLSWMNTPSATCPQVQIVPWHEAADHIAPGEVLIEAFGCHSPDSYLQQAAVLSPHPVWINLEYLSAQPYAAQCHGLPSPQQAGPAKGLTRWFYYPGFTPETGGLLREPELLQMQQNFDCGTWLLQHGIPVMPDHLRVSLFCYANHGLPDLIAQWQNSATPVHLLVTPGATAQALNPLLSIPATDLPNAAPQSPVTLQYGRITITWLPFLSQQDFDHLLWSSDLNMVRGEDSWIRAIWAGKPFIWQPYIQDDGEHQHKLDAFLALVPDAPSTWVDFERQWSTQSAPDWACLLSSFDATALALKKLKQRLMTQPDLATSLIRFVQQKSTATSAA